MLPPTDVSAAVLGFKQCAADLDHALAEGNEPARAGLSLALAQHLADIGAVLNSDVDRGGPSAQFVRRELLPYVLLGRSSERAYTKPLGYGGDYATIDLIYRNRPDGVGRIGPAVDALFLALPAANAVRNRRALVADDVRRELARHPARPVRVMSIGCGPAREVLDAFADDDARARLHVTLLDMDAQALEQVRRALAPMGLEAQLTLLEKNAISLALGRTHICLPPQDFIYSIGLIDYLADDLAVHLLNRVHGMLAPGGRVVVGNFHPHNPCRGLMDHLFDWKLIHRSEDDMHRLFRRSRFGSPCSRIVFEAEGINLFAECLKAQLPC